jgi:copper chaperone CopZ
MKPVVTLAAVLLFGGVALAKDVTAEIKVKGMTCGSCAVAVKQALTKTKGVKSADVSVERALAAVVYNDAQVTERELRQAIDKTGFRSESPAKEK